MARKVKCAITNEEGTSDTFIKIGNKYYKSQEIYDESQRKKILYKQIIDYICIELMNYQKGQVFPTIITKKIKELEFYDYEVIYNTLVAKANDIKYSLYNKTFNSDVQKVFYLFAIVKNAINDEYQKWLRNKKVVVLEKKSIIEVETDIEHIGSNIKGKDISNLLEDDEI